MRAPTADVRSFSGAPYLGFGASAHRHRMGLRRLEPGSWLEPDANSAWQRELKAELVATDRPRWVHDPSTPAADQGVERLAELLSAELGTARSEPFEPTIEWCGLATQEDWCLMVREDTWRLRAACVCFPSRWVLADKVGGTIASIHAPVPRYEAELGGLVESFFDRLRPDRSVWRTNWNLWDDPRLSQPWRESDAPVFDPPPIDEVGERVFLRVERQTLRRLTDDAIAFSIRVHQRPLGQLAAQEGALDALRSTLGALSDGAVAPRKLGHLAAPINAWLEAR